MKKILVVNGMIVAGLFIMFAIFASRPEQVPQQAAPPPTPKSGACVIDGVVDCAKARAAWIKTHPKEYAVEQERDRRAQKDVETKAQSKAQQEDAYRAAQVGAIMLRRNMRNPDSFILEQVLVMPKAACYRYRSQNGFGGMNREYAVYPRGASGMLIDNPSAWNRYCANQEGDDATAAIKMLLHIVE